MKVTIAWWDLSGSAPSIESLREYLHREGVKEWSGVPGLRLKFWIADRERRRWGAVLLWESDDAREQPNLPAHASGLIGYPPTELMRFDVEAVAEGLPFTGKE
jgi:hypothetical protein